MRLLSARNNVLDCRTHFHRVNNTKALPEVLKLEFYIVLHVEQPFQCNFWLECQRISFWIKEKVEPLQMTLAIILLHFTNSFECALTAFFCCYSINNKYLYLTLLFFVWMDMLSNKCFMYDVISSHLTSFLSFQLLPLEIAWHFQSSMGRKETFGFDYIHQLVSCYW